MMKHGIFLLALMAMLTGCVDFQYEGIKEAEPTADVAVFTDSAKIKRTYRVLGEATASGNYMDVSRDRLLAKMVKEAEKCGADAVLVTEQQVIPGKEQFNSAPKFNSSFDFDNESSSWRQIYQDVDLRYGSVRGTPNDNSTVTNYVRVIRAEFLKYTAE